MTSLAGKVALVTGASSGIGEATARLFAERGATVVLAARREEAMVVLAEEIASAGGTASYIRTDVSDAGEVEAMVAHAVDTHGRLDIAVWAPIDENPWQRCIMGIIKEHIDLPTPQPRAPGPFALGDQDYVIDLLQSAGFCGISFDAWTGEQRVGGPGSDPESAARFVLDGMHIGDLVRPSDAEVRDAIQRDLVALFGRNRDDDGVRMGAKAWLVSASA